MRIIRHPAGIPASVRGASVAIGNFDGVHRGHQAVIGEARRIATELGTGLVVVTFEPHPRRFFRAGEPPFELTPLRSKIRLFHALGVDAVLLVHFDAATAGLAPEDFVGRYLVDGLAARHVVVGYDFVFGKGRRGNAELLRSSGAAHGFDVTAVAPVRDPEGEVFSSTKIRQALREARPDRAAALLGRCWEIEGRVQHGDERGHTIGFATANLTLGTYLQPALGVYAVWAGVEAGARTEWHMGCTNIGRRPTFDGRGITVETHLLDFAGDLYGRLLRVALVAYLRPEQRFAGVEALTAQIGEDARAARTALQALRGDPLRGPPEIAAAAQPA